MCLRSKQPLPMLWKTNALALTLSALPVYALETGMAWDWQLQEPRNLDVRVEVLDLDPEATSSAEISAVKHRGIYTICYVSVGTVEDWREDASAFPKEVVGHDYTDWPGEAFLDIRALDVLLPIMTRRFENCRAKGFDAVEPDNMDVHINQTGFEIEPGDVIKYVKTLADIAHRLGLDIGQKNVPDLTLDLVDKFDFAITENCYSDGWCEKMDAYITKGKPVFAAEYDTPVSDYDEACRTAQNLGVSMIFKTYDLTSATVACP